jgi:hypothetical protein
VFGFASKADIRASKMSCPLWVKVRFTPNGDQKSGHQSRGMSALPPKADSCSATCDVRFGPIADSCTAAKIAATWRASATVALVVVRWSEWPSLSFALNLSDKLSHDAACKISGNIIDKLDEIDITISLVRNGSNHHERRTTFVADLSHGCSLHLNT